MDSTIVNQITSWAETHLGSEFAFREHQVESIHDIITNITGNGNRTHIIEAPTGSGKSLLCIIAAGVLAENYGMKSYILCSDLYLYSQYEDFIKKHSLDYGYIKGQTGNYFCDKNGEDMRNAECRMAKISWQEMYNTDKVKNLGFSCAKYCTYIADRKRAQSAKVTLMTYQLYFYMVNVVGKKQEHSPFPQRDVIFCDECHNIPQLVQGKYTPTVKASDVDYLVDLYDYNARLHDGGIFDDDAGCSRLPWATVEEMKGQFSSIWGAMAGDNSDDYSTIFEYIRFIEVFEDTVSALEDSIATIKRSKSRLSKEDTAMYKRCSWYRNYCCHLGDFADAVSSCGKEYLVKAKNMTNTEVPELAVSFNCAKEDYMCWKYLLSSAPHSVLMSATVGMKAAFDDNIGTKYSDTESYMQRIPSSFDFSKSPVIVSGKWKMSYEHKDRSFPEIKRAVYEIIRQFGGFRGMVQTGSYANAKEIYFNAPADIKQRLLLYGDSSEKKWAIAQHQAAKDSVLIGPTLVEGVDLPEDMCRFIIIAKVPFPNLKDKLVQAKIKLFPKWYDSEAANSIIQGIGRGNRTPKDWCVTYILDGCFGFLYKKTQEQFSPELTARMKQIG